MTGACFLNSTKRNQVSILELGLGKYTANLGHIVVAVAKEVSENSDTPELARRGCHWPNLEESEHQKRRMAGTALNMMNKKIMN